MFQFSILTIILLIIEISSNELKSKHVKDEPKTTGLPAIPFNNPACSMPGSGIFPECQKPTSGYSPTTTAKSTTIQKTTPKTTATTVENSLADTRIEIQYQEFVDAVKFNGDFPTPTQQQFDKYMSYMHQKVEQGLIGSSKTEAAMILTHMIHETGGLVQLRETRCAQTQCAGEYNCPSPNCNRNCDVAGQYYYGRGYLQLTWCYNYEGASKNLYNGNANVLLQDPDMVARDEDLAWKTAFWFWGEIVHPVVGPDEAFGRTVDKINGDIECQGGPSSTAQERFRKYANVRRAFRLEGPGNTNGCNRGRNNDISTGENEDANTNYFGVAFGPFTKYGNPPYDTYKIDDIKAQLNLISENNRHNLVTTYSAGARDYNLNRDCDHEECIMARAAAEINREKNSVVISMSQGIYQQNDETLMKAEIDRAFNEAREANRIKGGTIWGLVFTNEYIVNRETGNRVLQMLLQRRQEATNANLRIGVRIHVCPAFYNVNDNPALTSILREVVQASDFIMCNIYPGKGIGDNVKGGVDQVVDQFQKSRAAIRQIKNVEVMIGETGWATEKDSFFNEARYNTVRNMKDFWQRMKTWATNSQVKVHMFEAIDEPNKSVEMGEGERHFGYWYRATDNSNTYHEKKA